MTYYIKNNLLVNDENLISAFNNRMFRYSDGFFETCIVQDDGIFIWPFHIYRINKAIKVLQLKNINLDEIQNSIVKLHSESKNAISRVNIYFWRQEGGLYSPANFNAENLIALNEYTPLNSDIEKIGISTNVTNHFSSYSFFKTNSLKYVLAGLEKSNKHWDDIIVLDQNGNISECLSSNIFWIIEGEYFTPSIETGCVEGVYRNFLIDKLVSEGKKVNIGFWKPEILAQAHEIFCTNITGIRKIKWNA